MPIGLQRFNEKVKRPNEFITFIHPLKELPDEARAKATIDKVAAQMVPIMQSHGFSVMSLEE